MLLAPWLRECLQPSAVGSRITRPLFLAAWLMSGYLVARSYRKLIATHGLSPYALAERDNEKTDIFYDHLFQEVVFPAELTVLDIGCGLGDVIPYLQYRGHKISGYCGLDLVQAFVDACQQRYTESFSFQCQNFIHPVFEPQQKFALVVNMGCLVSRVFAYEDYVAYTCAKMLRFATHGVVFNVITAVEASSPEYVKSSQIGNTTTISKPHLLAILERLTHNTAWSYSLHDVRIYPDATDTFVYLFRH